MRLAACLLSVLTLASCAGARPEVVKLDTPLTAEQVGVYKDGGKGKISGQAFLRQDGGEIVTCAGSEVFLMPDIASTRELVDLMREGNVGDIRIGGERPSKLFPHAFKKKWCDRYGGFRFDRLADGTWIVLTAVHWTEGLQEHGSVIADYVDVENGALREIVMTDAHRI